MKKLLFFLGVILLLAISPKMSSAQNGGQADSNYVAKIEFLGYNNGQYILAITSNTSCAMSGVVRINSEQHVKHDVSGIVGNTTDTFHFTAPAGASKITFKPDNNSCCVHGDAGLLEIVSCGPLPIKWGNISATQIGNSIQINWTTETEQNNSYFAIERSYDGVNFEKVAEVQTKAINGNSALPINYSVDIPIGAKALAGIGILGIFGILFVPKKKRISKLKPLLIMGCLSSVLIFYSCQKENSKIEKDNHTELFLRIAQINNGTPSGTNSETYSKVIRVSLKN